MRVGIATDHGGFGLKQDLAARLRAAGHDVVDFGADKLSPDDDYPDFVVPLAQAVAAGTLERGVAVCGSGVGASICANKIPGVRAALAWTMETATLARQHNDANVLSLGAREYSTEDAVGFALTFVSTPFSGAPRHARRLAMIADYEKTGELPPLPSGG